jgi:hypothetical protein
MFLEPTQQDAHVYKPIGEKCIGCPRKEWQEIFKYSRNWVSQFCQVLVTGDAGKELKAKGRFVIIILAFNTRSSY